ncbi:arginase family protein, partial [Bacillus altitudinis]|uniref:arginase family protein n=1 Tax=Bacillus altitudinis TaxID=293387 RepID=UPI003B5156CF
MPLHQTHHHKPLYTTQKLKNLTHNPPPNHLLPQNLTTILHSPSFPLILGADHSIPIPTLPRLPKHYQNFPLISYHPHRHLNTHQTSPSRNIHPIPLPLTLPFPHPHLINIPRYTPKLNPHNVIFIPPRSLNQPQPPLITQKA